MSETFSFQHCTGVILAGGEGSRMGGKDKGWILWQNRPMIEYAVALLSSYCDHVVISANRNLPKYKELSDKFSFIQIDVVKDQPVSKSDAFKYSGPLAGLLAAAQACKTSHIILLPCDTPHVTSEWFTQLIEFYARESKGGSEVCMTHDGEQNQPLHGIFPVKLIKQTVPALLEQNKLGFQRWLTSQNLMTFTWPQADQFINMNTQQDLSI